MTGGPDDARPPEDEPNAVDAAWDALIEETGQADDGSGRDDARAEAGAAADAAPQRVDADDEMARLMGGAAPKLPVLEQGDAASAESGVEAKRAEQVTKPVAEVKPIAAARPVASPTPAAPMPGTERSSRPSLQVVAKPSNARANARDDRPVRASRPAEAIPSSPPAAGPPWAWIGAGAVILAVAAYLVVPATRDDPRAPRRDIASPSASPDPPDPDPVARPTPSEAGSTGDGSSGSSGSAGADPGTAEPKEPRSTDPREPPPGTPPEIAAVFRHLPVAPYDRPPVGGIGKSGIHIDHIAMGSQTKGATCSGKSDAFSVSQRERAAVCVRVVHPREKEELQVLWQKHDGSTRRSKMVVLPMHAYRTRGYLVLRSEYIGDWTVHILSSDGVELARHDFTVVP